jgi:UDP-glucose 4-epimerase
MSLQKKINYQPEILVTGGAGYIGSQTILNLQQKGYKIIVLDNFSTGHKDIVQNVLKLSCIEGDVGDRQLLNHIFQNNHIQAVIHFAASAYVSESIDNPIKYYRNNVANTLTLLEAMLAANVKNIVFSSTCATYGIPLEIPIKENHPQNPINPYGTSKLAIERIIKDFEKAYGLRFIIFRYFNAAGADPNGNLGEDHKPEPHLIPLVLLAALGKIAKIDIYGSDYSTPDGTCIRDYIHVQDIAIAHVIGLEYLLTSQMSQIFNLSNGQGFSVWDIIKTVQDVTHSNILVNQSSRRLGDPAILVGDSQKVRQILGWQPKYSELQQIISHAWQWHQKRHV